MNRNTILASKIRPTVRFDVTNPEHRYWAYKFINTMRWGECPYIFALPSTDGNVYNMLCKCLAEWYSQQEFSVAEKPLPEKVVSIGVDRRVAL